MQLSFVLLSLAACGDGALLRSATVAKNATATKLNATAIVSGTKLEQVPTFQSYYESVTTGRGMWKWSASLDAYQAHFSPLANRPTRMLEIGVQSGGSIFMYHNVLPQTFYYGMDINTNCLAFNDARTTISLNDQNSVPGWKHFFQAVTSYLDICIDDGGHQSYQMKTTIEQALPHINPGGFYLTEDIHGVHTAQDYLHNFFHPAAHTIATFASLTGATVQSVHLYPFVLGVQMTPVNGQVAWAPPAGTAWTSDIPTLMNSLPHNLGGVVGLHNPAWGSFFTVDALVNFFNTFYGMMEGIVREEPPHCHQLQDTNQCAMIVTNTHLQDLVKAVHIFGNYVLVEVHAAPPSIHAYRKGDI